MFQSYQRRLLDPVGGYRNRIHTPTISARAAHARPSISNRKSRDLRRASPASRRDAPRIAQCFSIGSPPPINSSPEGTADICSNVIKISLRVRRTISKSHGADLSGPFPVRTHAGMIQSRHAAAPQIPGSPARVRVLMKPGSIAPASFPCHRGSRKYHHYH